MTHPTDRDLLSRVNRCIALGAVPALAMVALTAAQVGTGSLAALPIDLCIVDDQQDGGAVLYIPSEEPREFAAEICRYLNQPGHRGR